MATTPPPPTTGTSSTSSGWARDLGVGVSGVTRDLGNGHAVLEYLAPPGPPGRQVGTAVRADRQKGESRGSVPGWPPNIGPNGPGGCAIQSQHALYPNLIINDIMA